MKTLNFETAPLGFNELKKDLPTAIVKRLTIGKYWTLVETDRGSGLVTSPTGPLRKKNLNDLLVFEGQSTDSTINLCHSQNPFERAVGCATLNSLVNNANLDLSSENGLDIKACDNDKIVIVGRFPGLDHKLPEAYVLERNPGPKDYPESAAAQLIPECNHLIVTASTWVNGSLDNILRLAKNAKVSLIGPGTPLSPVFGYYGIKRLAGFVVTQPKSLAELISGGAGVKQFKHLGYFGVLNIND